MVVHELDTRPFPDIPFPNDLGARLDPSSPTGRRLNVSMTGESRLERQVRIQLNGLDGWGVSAPITVSFDAPLDLDDLAARHQANLDLSHGEFFFFCFFLEVTDMLLLFFFEFLYNSFSACSQFVGFH